MQDQPTPTGEPGGLRALRRVMRDPVDKAAALIAENRVTPCPAARVYEVRGEHGTYHVIATPQGIFCPCPARTAMCSHVLAVAHVRSRETTGNGNGHANGTLKVIG